MDLYDDTGLKEVGTGSEEIFNGRLLHVFRDTVTLPNGHTSTREYIKHNGAVCVIPITDDGMVYLVRQYRYPVGRVTLELPAGKIDPGEDPLTAAVRELGEETGLKAEKLTDIGAIYPSVAYTTEGIYNYVATGLTEGPVHTDPDEFLSVIKMPIDELTEMILDGKIWDSKTQAAILKVKYLREAGRL